MWNCAVESAVALKAGSTGPVPSGGAGGDFERERPRPPLRGLPGRRSAAEQGNGGRLRARLTVCTAASLVSACSDSVAKLVRLFGLPPSTSLSGSVDWEMVKLVSDGQAMPRTWAGGCGWQGTTPMQPKPASTWTFSRLFLSDK
eukprot:CAMPEP_0180456220 /NCGR_PEP_ID=MMETSP1036_2-20121128/21193_1 /TAXON_ID=632150 /ORGANISM="Azadinium spinosum, Strain 3D9" /LENGTH=143 /DNA_ID=CAMNT_0022462787 /DNA_START=303 /DNA_END=734 /DNA_ORIENTATION=-